MSKWNIFLRELRSIGQFLVKNDDYVKNRLNLLDVDTLPQWQTGAALWWASEVLTLLNFFFPFDKQFEKMALEKKISELERAKNCKTKSKRFYIAQQ